MRFWSLIWIAMILAQIGLGAWTIWSNKAAECMHGTHDAGALCLLMGALISFRLFCGARTQDFILPDERNRRLIEPWHENRDDSDLALGPLAGDLFDLVKARLSLLVLLTTLVGFLMGWQGPMNYCFSQLR